MYRNEGKEEESTEMLMCVRASCTAGALVVAPHQVGLAHVCGHALSAPSGRLGC